MSTSAQKIVVLGAGMSGYGAACLGRKLGADVTVLDGGAAEKLAGEEGRLRALGCEVIFGPGADEAGLKPDLVVVSPGIDLRRPIVRQFADQGIKVIAEVEFAFQHCKADVVAITGTNGKTTTTEMVTAVLTGNGLRAFSVGNYGRAFSEVIADGDGCDVYVTEVSSFQLEALETFRPKVSVWMNFAPDHLDRYDSVEDYFQAKRHIFDHQTADDVAVIHAEDRDRIGRINPWTVTFSAWEDADYTFEPPWIRYGGDRVADVSTTPLRGTHNAENLMATLAVAAEYEIRPEQVMRALATYHPPAHRCELVRMHDGHEYINDSKATNVHALESALRGLDDKVVLIAGGKDKGLDYEGLTPLLASSVETAVLIGQTAERMMSVWSGVVPCMRADSLEQAVRKASSIAKPGQTILFSPGASSFDMFSSYIERGETFRQIVNRL